MKDPIVIDPPGFDCKAAWNECREYVDKCGGLQHDDGEPNWRAAFGADPGCCSCPVCKEYFWCWGRVIRCTECGFEFPTDWWPLYSWGVQHANRGEITDQRMRDYYAKQHAESMSHPYYRYGYEHPVPDPWEEHDKIDWRAVLKRPAGDGVTPEYLRVNDIIGEMEASGVGGWELLKGNKMPHAEVVTYWDQVAKSGDSKAKLRERSGTPEEFDEACQQALGEISFAEYQYATRRYREIYDSAP